MERYEPSCEERLIGRGIEQCSTSAGVGGLDHDQPAVTVRLLVDQLGTLVDQRVALDDRAADAG